MFAAMRSGLYYTPVNFHLNPEEAAYMIADCDARIVLAAGPTLELAAQIRDGAPGVSQHLPTPDGRLWVSLDGPRPGFVDLEAELVADDEARSLPERPIGRDMLYSSGTTGRPKGVRRPLTPASERARLIGTSIPGAGNSASTSMRSTSRPARSTMPARCATRCACSNRAEPASS